MVQPDDDKQQSLGALTSALARALRLSHFTIESAPELVLWLSETGQITRVNRAVTAALGIAAAQLVGQPMVAFLDETGTTAFEACVERVRSKYAPASVEVNLSGLSGSMLTVEMLVASVEVDDGRYCCVFARDITERKRTERALAGALEELETLKLRLEDENRDLKRELSEDLGVNEMVGQSGALRTTLQRAHLVAGSDASVLIQGESGTGKELLARSIHRHSRRASAPLVKVNCAALPESLIESELFGHEKGAFTHAVARRLGRFELADGGTIFLDEIGELPLTLQPKLLRVLQEGEFERVGGDKTLKVDVRLVAATNQDLAKEVAAGRFRADLYYRLSVVPLAAPALRDRREDIPLLAQHFVNLHSVRAGKRAPGMSPGMLRALIGHDWPGNVRELSNVIERAVILHRAGPLQLDEMLSPARPAESQAASEDLPTLRAMEVTLIRKALRRTGGVIGGRRGAARLLDIPDSTLRERIQRFGITADDTVDA